MSAPALSPELTDAAAAVGLLKADKTFDASWFDNPIARLTTILSNPPQRQAAMQLLDALVPPSAGIGAPAGEEWHPLLNGTPNMRGNLYLTVRTDGGGTTVLGLAGGLTGPAASPTTASLHAHVPLISANGGTVTAVAGSATSPVEIDLRLEVEWSTPANAIGLKAVRAHVALPFTAPQPAPVVQIILEQLDLGGGPVPETVLDPAHLGPEALNLISGLLTQELKQLAGSAAGAEAKALAAHLMPLLGLGDGLKPLPLDQLVHGGTAIRQWFADMVASPNAGDLRKWLGHLAGLVGSATGTAPVATGTEDDPWKVPLIALTPTSSVALALAIGKAPGTGTAGLLVKLLVELAPAGAHPAARLDAAVTLAMIPLSGTSPAATLPAFSVALRAPGDPADPLLTGAVSVDHINSGITWDGSQLRPILELVQVTTPAGSFAHLDLTNADSVVSAAGSAVRTAILNFLGTTPAAQHLAALVGLVEPTGQTGTWPHLLDPLQLASHPTQAIAKVHADVLADAVHNWSYLLNELRLLVGLANAVTGSGTEHDPWFASLGTSGPIGIGIAAWKAAGSAPPQRLRVGLVAKASTGGVLALSRVELFGFDIQTGGGTTIQMLGHLHIEAGVDPLPTIPPFAGIQVGAKSLAVSADLAPGSPATWTAGVKGISVSADGAKVQLDLSFPTVAPFDLHNPMASLGISVGDLEALLRMLVSHALLTWGGMSAYTLGALLGIHRGLSGLQPDWPTLTDPLGAGSLFDHPVIALRNWLEAVATGLSTDGTPFALELLAWLQAFLQGSLPAAPHLDLPAFDFPVMGSGTYDDPWAVPLQSATAQRLEALAWLEPAGPPATWAAALAPMVLGVGDFAALLTLIEKLAGFVPSLRALTAAINPTQMADSLRSLRDYLASSDGVVPLASQVPTGGTWAKGATPLTSAHHLQPKDPAAISQVLSQVDNWAGTNPRAVLLLGPAFSDSTIWHDLLAAAETARPGSTKPGTNFNLRVPNVSSDAVDLSDVTASADIYTADLFDDGSGDRTSLIAQIGRVVARITQIRADAPNLKVTLVAHSTAGLAARLFTANHPALIAGLITIGSPHQGSPLTPIVDPAAAGAVRFVQNLVPNGVGGHVQEALDHLVRALDGFVPVAGGPSLAAAYPVGSFTAPASTDTAGVSALALGGSLHDDLFKLVQHALNSVAVAAGSPAAASAPTHLAFGVRAGLGLHHAAPGEVAADATLRADAFRVQIKTGAVAPAHPAQRLVASIVLSRPDGWLLGGPTSFAGLGAAAIDVRVRWLEMGMEVVAATGGQLELTRRLALHDAAFHGPLLNDQLVDAASAQAVLGAVFHQIADPAPAAGTPIATLLQTLQSLGLAVPDPHGGIGLSADAWTALETDPVGYLSQRISAALSGGSGLLGLTGPPSGPWALALAGVPVELYIARPWAVGVRTTSAGTATKLSFGDSAAATFDARVTIPSFAPTFDTSLTVGAVDVAWSEAKRQLTVAAPPWIDSLVLYPVPSVASLEQLANQLIPRLALSAIFSALIQYVVGPGWTVGPIDALLASPGAWLSRPAALGTADGGLDAGKITGILNAIADAAGYSRGRGLDLPQGLELWAAGKDPLVISVTTQHPIGGVVDVQLTASVDRLHHVTPGGSVTLHATLPGAGTWGSLAVTLGIGASGVTVTLTPGTGDPIQLLPHFSGLGALAAGGTALLPGVLDDIVNEFGPPAGRPPMVVLALDLAHALDIWDSVGGFAAHASQIAAIGKPGWMASVGATLQTAAINAAVQLVNDPSSPLHGALPGTLASASPSLSWSLDLATLGGGAAAGVGTVGVTLGWTGGSPALSINASGARPAGGAVVADVTAGYASGQLTCSLGLQINVPTGLSFDFGPRVTVSLDAGRFTFKILPLGAGTDSLLAVQLAPTPALTTAPGGLGKLVEGWLVPVIADLLLAEFKADLAKNLWSAGPTAHDLLTAAKLVTAGDALAKPLPSILDVAIGLGVGLATGVEVDVTTTLKLSLVDEAGNLGARLVGTETFQVGDYGVNVNLGPSRPWLTDPDRGLTLYLVDNSGSPVFKPSLKLIGVGVGLAGSGDANLVDTSVVTMQGVDTYVFLTLPLDSGAGVADFGAALEVKKLGLPLGTAISGSAGGSNPVAASLVSSDSGSQSSPGDSQPVNPSLDVMASYRPGAGLVVQFENQSGPLWIPVHHAFGPIYLDQVGIGFIPPPDQGVDILVDGGVKVAGLSVSVYELGVTIPFKSVLAPDHWSLDLKGLAVGFKTTGVAIAGGLIKNPGPPIEYDGMLLVDLSGRSFTVVGSYARPSDAQGSYTSLFIFVSLPIVIGGPPYLFITGLGGGAGYNRRLLVPADINAVETFVLVEAIDDDSFANDPMNALMSAALAIPPRRGSLWFAAGLRFTSFVVVHSVVVVYVALDRGLEIGVLGLSRMALPTDDDAIASVELALKARFSTAEALLSVQAQLTDNSWLLSQDCQLTGGFAFFMWFQKAQFVLTLGGYHHAFVAPSNFPTVPRLGFHWSVSDAITIKGESYFALTNSCVMAGGRLSASFQEDGIRVWFDLYADFLVSWDPFHYDIDIGVDIGASFSIQICFLFGCATIGISVSLSAEVHVFGPPLHGDAKVDLDVASVTVSFGALPTTTPDYITDWQVFADKYLLAGDPDKTAVSLHVLTGLLPPEPPGATPAPGTEGQPWKMAAEFSFLTESRMPTNLYSEFVTGVDTPAAGASTVDIAPMAQSNAAAAHRVVLDAKNDGDWQPATADSNHFDIQAVIGQVPEATWRFIRPDQQRAAANTIPALTGLKIIGRAVIEGQSALIPISKLVDAGSSPLPLSLPQPTATTLQDYGAQADTLAGVAVGAVSAKVLAAAASMLHGNGTFAKLRSAAGLPAPGLSPMAVRSLTSKRSAPPLVTPISTGLTMRHRPLGAPPVISKLPDVAPITLSAPRLRAVLQGRPPVVGDAPPPVRTSAKAVSIVGALPRMAPPQLSAQEGARLVRLASPVASRPTSASLAGRTVRSPELGWSAGTVHGQEIDGAAADVLADGVVVAAGATHLWDLPTSSPMELVASGGALRITGLTRAGNILLDVELVAGVPTTIALPKGCALLAVTCLGTADPGPAGAPSLGAVAARVAPPGGVAAAGWQTGNLLPQVGPSVLLGRGASLTVPRATIPTRGGQRTTDAMVRISEAVAAQPGVETRLPAQTTTVMIILDQNDPSAALDGDLAVYVQGATLSLPLRVGGGRRLGLIYDVVTPHEGAQELIIAVGSRTGWRLNGVVGLGGRAREWATFMSGGIPQQLVPDGPLTPEGQTLVRLQPKAGGWK